MIDGGRECEETGEAHSVTCSSAIGVSAVSATIDRDDRSAKVYRVGGGGADDIVHDPFLLNTTRVERLDAARLAAAFDAASDAFFDVDLENSTIQWSRGLTLLFGHDPERVGTGVAAWRSFVHPDDAREVMESGRALLPSGERMWSREFRFARADGSYAPVRVRAFVVRDGEHPSHVVGAMTDLSELRSREEELQEVSDDLARELEVEHEERARADLLLQSATVEVLAEWDLRTGRINYSPNAEAVLGHPAAEIADIEGFMRHTDPDDGPRQLADLQTAIESGATSWSSPRFRFRRADGVEIHLASRGFIVRDDAGQAIRTVGSVVPLPAETSDAPLGPHPTLTDRQRLVLGLVREGKTNKEIAGDLGISEQAAKVQVRKLLRKFGVANRAALAAIRYLSILAAVMGDLLS